MNESDTEHSVTDRKTPTPLSLCDAPDVLTIMEAASILRLGRNGMYEAVRTRQVPAIRIGKRLLIAKRTIERMLDHEQEEAPCVEASDNA